MDLRSNFLVNNLLSVNTGAQPNIIPHCEKHQEDILELYCQLCEQPICYACKEIDHRGHSYKFVKEAFPHEKKKVANLVKEAKPKISALKAEATSLEREEEQVRNNALAVSQEIDSLVDDLINEHTVLLEQKRQRLKEDLSEMTLVQIGKLREQKESLFLSLNNVEASNQILDSTNKVEFLRRKNEITNNLAELQSVAEKFTPCEKVVYKLDKKTTVGEEKDEEIGKICSRGECSLSMRGGEPGVLYTGRAFQTCEFIIARNSVQALGLRNVFDNFKVKILEPNAAMPFCPSLENNADGTHSFRFQPGHSGIYKISVCSEKISEGEIHGSPFSWNVLPALYLRSWVGWIFWFLNLGIYKDSTYLSDCLLENGQHSWRIKILNHIGPNNIPENFVYQRIGVVHPLHHSTWCWQNGQHIAPGHDPVPSPMKSVQHGDVFVVFLDIDKRQMIIYNERTKESDVWRGIKAPVTPFLYPDVFLNSTFFIVSNV